KWVAPAHLEQSAARCSMLNASLFPIPTAARRPVPDTLPVLQAIAGFESSNAPGVPRLGNLPPELRSFVISEQLGQQVSRDAFDPRLIGDELQYLDNGRASDTLVVYLSRWCVDPTGGVDLLRPTPYRAVAPSLFGFNAERRYRIDMQIADHLVLLAGLVRELVATTGALHPQSQRGGIITSGLVGHQ
ncbi:MAG TPA: hypothetical protein VE869_00210, partial [Gemmatimonas sp.]|nr:hypothetical protein [Gemmatimonas sp.]